MVYATPPAKNFPCAYVDHYELEKNKYRSSTIYNMKKYIFSYNNISTIRAVLIAVRCKKGFHEII